MDSSVSPKDDIWFLRVLPSYRVSEKDCTFFKNFIYQKLGNKSKFFSTLQRFNMGALRDTADIKAIVHFRPYSHQQVSCNGSKGSKGYNLFRTRCRYYDSRGTFSLFLGWSVISSTLCVNFSKRTWLTTGRTSYSVSFNVQTWSPDACSCTDILVFTHLTHRFSQT